ncbi:EFR1 family ferrodoxin [Mycoplasmatota bacterium WC30]
MSNLYLYFSGTGNTKYVIDKFISLYEEKACIMKSIEHNDFDYKAAIMNADIVIIAYPIHDSMMPFIMIDFLEQYKENFRDKKIMTIVTQMLFSGDGGALAYRQLKSVNVKLLHSIHINMPNNLTNVPVFKALSLEKTDYITLKADMKIEDVVNKIKDGKTLKMGRKFYSWALGFFTQRGLGKPFVKRLRKRLKIYHEKCIKCKKCIDLCPMDNLYLEADLIKTKNKCTLCYRCINACPTQAISQFMMKPPKIQYIRKDFN